MGLPFLETADGGRKDERVADASSKGSSECRRDGGDGAGAGAGDDERSRIAGGVRDCPPRLGERSWHGPPLPSSLFATAFADP